MKVTRNLVTKKTIITFDREIGLYSPGALTKSQSQSQHMVGPLEGPNERKEGQQVDRWRRRLRKASPREGIAQERRRLAKVSPKKGVASLKHRPWKASPGKETVKWRYRRCYPSIPMGREDHGGGNTVRKSWAPMVQNSNEEKMASRP